MPSNEALELVENVLNEANNSRLKYIERLGNQAEEMRNSGGIKNYIKAPKVERENIKKIQKYTIGDPDSKKYYPYGDHSSKLTTRKDDHKKSYPKEDKWLLKYLDREDKNPKEIAKGNIGMNKTIGRRYDFEHLKDKVKNPSKDEIVRKVDSEWILRGLPTDDLEALAKAKRGKEAYMKDFGGPEKEYNSIHSAIDSEPLKLRQGKYYYDGTDKYNKNQNKNSIEFEKELLKDRVENAKKNPRKVIGGYKLESMYTIAEALDKVLNEYEYNEDGANVICESSSILIEALNTLLNE